MEPRKPNQKEKQELSQYLAEEYRTELEDEADVVENAYIGVFDSYITDGPGYAGKVMMVVWPASPSIFDVFTWDNERQIRREEREN